MNAGEILAQRLNSNSYSNQPSSKTTVTVTVGDVFRNLADIIPDDDYRPFYIKRYKQLGYKRFMELANKARAGKTPDRLFFWMLKNNEIVR